MTLTTAAPPSAPAPTPLVPPPGAFAAAANPAPAAPNGPVAQAPARQNAAVLDLDSLAAALSATADPASALASLVLCTAEKSATAAKQGQVLSTVEDACKKMLKNVRAALLASVVDAAHPNGRPGIYDGFTITAKAGSRSLSYSDLEANYPDVYRELVSVGKPSLVLSYTG